MNPIQKIGLLVSPDVLDQEYSHASTPFPHISDSKIVVLFNRRDKQGRSHVFSIDLVAMDNSFKAKFESIKHIMAPGGLGSFDDSGVSVGSILRNESSEEFYYMGWNLGVTVPWRNTIGLAKYNSELNELTRYRRSPILDRNEEDPFTLSYPWIIEAHNKLQMFYGSNKHWDSQKADIAHVLKRANSIDGTSWETSGELNIEGLPKANAFCRPTIIPVNGGYLMAYAFRKELYQIGFAVSKDLQSWKNIHVMMPSPETEWESREVTYPALFDYKKEIFLLYCGNGYGKTGFGLAIISIESLIGNSLS